MKDLPRYGRRCIKHELVSDLIGETLGVILLC